MSEGPRIYNIFPLLAGRLARWRPHLERARAMECNWIFVNAFHIPKPGGGVRKDLWDRARAIEGEPGMEP